MTVMLATSLKKSQTLGDRFEHAVLEQVRRKQFHQVARVVGVVLVHMVQEIVQPLAEINAA